ncbi:MAG TPA: YciI family protein [Hyphomicrobiaceae bacterium]|nr:YciI family protein [Hyphomicrobiaceae bacterium]
MTRWVAIFEDDPDADWVRKRHDQDHFAYLDEHAGKIRLGGGLRPAPGEWFVGGLWVLEVESREEAVRLIEGDPYFQKGLRRRYRLLVWGKAPCYGEVIL